MENLTIEEQEQQLLSFVPVDGRSIGNTNLQRQLGWPEDTYWPVRNRLVDRGVLDLGRGKGGSVRRVTKSESLTAPPLPLPASPDCLDEYDRESNLYDPMAKVLASTWSAAAGFDDKIVQITAQQGGKLTGGKWSRPDIAVVTLSTYPYVPGRHFDVITFEVKTAEGIDITCVYEALAHLRSATRSYVLLHVPKEKQPDLESRLLDVFAEAKKHGIGVITAENPADYDTWEDIVDPIRAEPDPRRLNDFLAKQFSKTQLELIMKWFK